MPAIPDGSCLGMLLKHTMDLRKRMDVLYHLFGRFTGRWWDPQGFSIPVIGRLDLLAVGHAISTMPLDHHCSVPLTSLDLSQCPCAPALCRGTSGWSPETRKKSLSIFRVHMGSTWVNRVRKRHALRQARVRARPPLSHAAARKNGAPKTLAVMAPSAKGFLDRS